MFLYEELACGVAVTKTIPVDKLEKQPSLGSLTNQTDQDSESVEGLLQLIILYCKLYTLTCHLPFTLEIYFYSCHDHSGEKIFPFLPSLKNVNYVDMIPGPIQI